MFGSSSTSMKPFGQSSVFSPFGSHFEFGQTSSAGTNPFAQRPLGSPSNFGSSSGSSLFGCTSTGDFGQPSTPTPGFGSSTSAFGTSPTPAFGAFGQSSVVSPFGSHFEFGQTSSAGTNPFAQRPFGSPSNFGSSSGSSLFGCTSTGDFGQPSTPTPGFGSSTSAFGTSPTPAFGASTQFGQNASFGGGFGPTPNGSTLQQTQPTYGSSGFGSVKSVGPLSQHAFGCTSTQHAFGCTSTPAFDSTSPPAFGAMPPAFGALTSPSFGATTTPSFGTKTTPSFGAKTTFGASNSLTSGATTTTPAFGSTTTPAFGARTAPAYVTTNSAAFGSTTFLSCTTRTAVGVSSAPAFGVTSTPSSVFLTPFGGSTLSFGQTQSTFGRATVGTISPPFGTQSPSSGAQTVSFTFGSQGFGQTSFGAQEGGSRVAKYTQTRITENSGSFPANSISAMPVYKDKSHEELRWEDYQRGDKGGPSFTGQSATGTGLPMSKQAGLSGPAFTIGQTSANPSSNPAATVSTPGSTGLVSTSTSVFSPPYTTSAPSSFSQTSSTTIGVSTTPVFGFPPSNQPASTSSTAVPGTQLSGLSQPSILFIGQTRSPLGQSPVGLLQQKPSGAPTGFGWHPVNDSAPSKPLLSTPGIGQTIPSMPPASPPATPAQPSINFNQTQPASSTGLGSTSSILGQDTYWKLPSNQSNTVMQPVPAVNTVNPYGTIPAPPRMFPGQMGSVNMVMQPVPTVNTVHKVQYGISSMPVAEKPTPIRISTLSAPRHLSQRRIGLPLKKYNAKIDGPKVPFFMDDEAQTLQKVDQLFVPRENPRLLPMEQWPSRAGIEKQPIPEDMHKLINENASPAENGCVKKQNSWPLSPSESAAQKLKEVFDDHFPEEAVRTSLSHMTISGNRRGESATVHEHGADIDGLLPKLHHTDYYTEPRIQELASKERAEPGFCCHVKDFVVGRHGYGSIKFEGETDVRKLDLESIIQFNNREVIVYKDESMKPLVGQGLNKPAEVTLLNVKCINKKTGQHYTEGPKVEKYKDMLMKKVEDQGAEFVCFDAIKGLWKFKVRHF